MKKILILLAALLFLAGGPVHSLQTYENPLACLEDAGDSAIEWTLNRRGRWLYSGMMDTPVLQGVHGAWYGYNNGPGWLGAFGWPNDMYAYRSIILYRQDAEVGQLWFYKSPTEPDLIVLFVFESMGSWADANGEHMGEHDFCWWGEVTNESE